MSIPVVEARSADPPAAFWSPRPAMMWATSILGLAIAVMAFALARASDVSDVQIALLEWISVPFVVAGLIAWWRRPESHLGVLMIAGGLVTGLMSLQFADNVALATIGTILDILPAAIFLHVYLAFPDGRLRSRFERLLVVTAYAVAIGLQMVKMSLGAWEGNALEITSRPDAALAVERVQLFSMAGICLAGLGILAVRRHASRPRRRSVALLIDSFAFGLVMIAVLYVDAAIQGPAFQTIQRATLLVVGLAPFAFLIGLLDARLARSSIGDLVIELRSDPAPTELRNSLARALRDPSLTLAYWVPDLQAYTDLDGQAVAVPTDDGRSVTRIDRNGAQVAVLLHDPALDDEPELLTAVGAAAEMALENARLQADLAVKLEEVKGSRAQTLAASHLERKRLERNLHDGAQQRLVALSVHLKLLEMKLGEQPEARRRLVAAQQEISLSLDELRDLAHGLNPAVLTRQGLAVALEQVVARSSVPVRLEIALEQRLPEAVEAAGYYVVTESLANIAKHANANKATIAIDRRGDEVVVDIADDGVGGADLEAGSGLRGLADRIEALGGHLRVSAAVGGGTLVHARIPCE